MSNSTEGPIVGIDLGTTNSVVAAVVNGKVQVLAEEGEQLLPSVVGFDPSDKLVTGTVARNQLVAFPDRTIASVKRKMGTMKPITLGTQEFTPPEISAMILRRLRDRASRVLGQSVTRAVITIPAFFDENQRQATREAGELAGFTVERIINEPTAATLVYHAGDEKQQHLVVYDLGGGTFDVSIVRMEAGVVEVLSSKGDTQLGGDDFDALLMQHVAEQFLDEHGIELRETASSRHRLLRACEQAKCRLSVEETVRISEEFIAEKNGQPLNLDLAVSRSEYEELISSLVDRTVECVDEALRDANLTINQIDDLVLVGGSTRTPLVEQRLRGEFLRQPSHAVDPDLAVALGAATQAAMLAGIKVGPVLVDVTNHTLGIAALDDRSFPPRVMFSPIIHRNSPLPASHEEAFSTTHDEQKEARIQIFQGEHPEIERNREIGEFMLDLEAGAGDREKIVVRFDLSLDGTLKVVAKQPATGRSHELSVDNALSQFQADQRDRAQARLGTMFDESEEILADQDTPSPDEWGPEGSEKTAPAESNTAAAKKYPAATSLLQRAQAIGPQVSGDDAEDLRDLVSQLQDAIADEHTELVESICEELDDVLFYVQ